ncbi:MAG: peptidyl-prolyl cis-trans isomerase [Solirubrobacterales bacterium]
MSGARKSGLIVFGALLVLLFVYVAIAQGIGNPGVPSGDVALVEDVPDGKGDISQKAFNRALLQTAKRSGLKVAPKPDNARYAEIREAAINDLLDQAWLTGEAAELGATATEREVDNEFQTIRQDQFPNEAAFNTFLKDSAFTEEEVLDRVRLQVLSRKIEAQINESVTEVPEKELKQFYEDSKDNFTTPETRDVRLVVTESPAEADQIEAALEKSDEVKDFALLAKKFSNNGSSSQGGKTVATEGAFPDPAGSEVMSADEGAVLGPIEAGGDFYFFRVEKINPEETQSFDDVKQQIQQQLLPTLQQQTFAEFVTDYNSKWTSRTFCAEDFLVARCSNYQGDGRLESADPACYEEGADEAISCPAPVGLRSAQSPGGNSLDPFGAAGGNSRPQGPVAAGDPAGAEDAGAAGVPGGIQQVPGQ